MIKIGTFFSGIGAPEKALSNLGIPFQSVFAVEFDKYAAASFNAIHGTDYSKSDVREFDPTGIECDLIVHGSPCQSFSIAGKGEGGDEGSGTRSSLMHVSCEHIGVIRPKVVIWENVKNVLSAKHKHNFEAYVAKLESFGYTSYWKVLNAKDYGIPQNRERIFCVSILGEHEPYHFPVAEQLTMRLADLLDDVVDEKYYLSDKAVDYMGRLRNGVVKMPANTKKGYEYAEIGDSINLERPTSKTRRGRVGKGVSQTITTQPELYTLTQIGNINENNSQANRVYSDDMARTLVGEAGGGGAKTGWYAVAQRGRYNVDGTTSQNIEISDREYANTITTVQKDSLATDCLRIRKLTPKECFRLMGFDDVDYENAKGAGVSESQLYKQAGNSIVVDVMEKIIGNITMWIEE